MAASAVPAEKSTENLASMTAFFKNCTLSILFTVLILREKIYVIIYIIYTDINVKYKNEYGEDLMEILIRNLEEATVKTLDRKAEKAGMSRQEYLLMYLNRLAAVDAYREEREEYSTLVKNMGVIIGNNTEQLSKVAELIEDIAEKMEEG